MNVYIVSFSKTTSSTTALIKEIVHMMDCVAGMKVLTHLPIYTDDRLSVEDYDCKIAFAAPPSTGVFTN